MLLQEFHRKFRHERHGHFGIEVDINVNVHLFAGKVELEKPLHLVIGSVTPTSVLLSWGTLLKTPYEGNVMNDCLEDG